MTATNMCSNFGGKWDSLCEFRGTLEHLDMCYIEVCPTTAPSFLPTMQHLVNLMCEYHTVRDNKLAY